MSHKGSREIFIEFVVQGAFVKATAIDPVSGLEASIVGPARAREMLLLGDVVDAARALELGLVGQVVPADRLASAARDLAVRLAQGPTRAYAATKAALDHAASSSLAEALEREAELQEECVATADHVAATKAFLNKETPTFGGR